MEEDNTYSLKELAELTGLSVRTIRAYISDGLIRGPETRGRHARYTEYHLKRLQTIQELKEHYGLPLSEVRRYLLMAGDEEDIQVVPMRDYRADARYSMEASPTSANFERVASEPDELDELLSLRNRGGRRPNPPLQKLVNHLRDAMRDHRVARQARSETIREIEVTPDLSLRVRGDFGRDEIALFEQLADALREALLGGLEHE